MNVSRRPPGELVLCSYGLVTMHITMETIMELKNCDVVFLDALDDESCKFLKAYCRRMNIFKDDGNEKEPYARQADTVMKELARGKRVGVVTYGHPGFLCAVADKLIKRCSDGGFKYRIIDSISSINCVLNMVGLRSLFPAEVFMASAISWTVESAKFYPRFHNLIFDLSNLLLKDRRHVLEAFAAQAGKKLPPGHAISLVEAPCIGDQVGRVVRTTPQGLKKTIEASTERSTLYIPAVVRSKKYA